MFWLAAVDQLPSSMLCALFRPYCAVYSCTDRPSSPAWTPAAKDRCASAGDFWRCSAKAPFCRREEGRIQEQNSKLLVFRLCRTIFRCAEPLSASVLFCTEKPSEENPPHIAYVFQGGLRTPNLPGIVVELTVCPWLADGMSCSLARGGSSKSVTSLRFLHSSIKKMPRLGGRLVSSVSVGSTGCLRRLEERIYV